MVKNYDPWIVFPHKRMKCYIKDIIAVRVWISYSMTSPSLPTHMAKAREVAMELVINLGRTDWPNNYNTHTHNSLYLFILYCNLMLKIKTCYCSGYYNHGWFDITQLFSRLSRFTTGQFNQFRNLFLHAWVVWNRTWQEVLLHLSLCSCSDRYHHHWHPT